MSKDLLPGGKADNAPDSRFGKHQLKKGKKTESEHTDREDLAKEIAKDHLAEDPKYYDKLEEMEKKAGFPSIFKEMYLQVFEKTAAKHHAVGAAIGAGVGAIGSGLREMRLRSEEAGTDSDSNLKKRRSERLKYHAGATALSAGAGAGAAHLGKAGYEKVKTKLKDTASKAKDSFFSGVDSSVSKASQQVKDRIQEAEASAKRVSNTMADDRKRATEGMAWDIFNRKKRE